MLHLDSRNRTGGTNAAPEFSLDRPILNVRSVRLVNAQIPRSNYNITVANSAFTLTDAIALVPMNIAIIPGFYSTTTLASVLQLAMNGSGGSAHYAVSYLPILGKFNIANGIDQFTISWGLGTSAATNLGLLMGFSGDVALTNSVNSANVCNINIDYTYQIRSRALTEGLTRYTVDAPERDTNLLFRVPIDVAAGDILLYEPSDLSVSYLSTRKFERVLDFELCDSFGNVIDLNGLSWRMTLQVL